MFGAVGVPELFNVSVIALMVFGPAKFPDFGKSLGAAIRGLKKAINELAKCAFERFGSPMPRDRGSRL
jgi:sec-independent protein translocase protein TatA